MISLVNKSVLKMIVLAANETLIYIRHRKRQHQEKTIGMTLYSDCCKRWPITQVNIQMGGSDN